MNILTQAAITAIGTTWQEVGDMDDCKAASPALIADHWLMVSNMCTAYALQHSHAQQHDEAASFLWLQDIAEIRASSCKGTVAAKLKIVSSMASVIK